MNSLQISLVVFGLVLVLGTIPGSAIKCYICNSGDIYEGDSCDPITSEDYLQDCGEWGLKYDYPDVVNATLCRKQVQAVQGESRVVRSCANEGRLDRCVERTGTKLVKVTYCECSGDGCNSGVSVVVSLLTLVASIFVAFSMRS